MTYDKMNFEERVDWSAAYLLKELLAGNFRRGVWMVLDMATRHPLPKRGNPRKEG